MFTGIIEEQGVIKGIEQKPNLATLTVRCRKVSLDTRLGDSIAVNGICMTVVKKTRTSLTFDLMRETLDCTTAKLWQPGQGVNLERALKAGDRLGGHFVSGHVDGVGTVKALETLENYVAFHLTCPPPLMRYLVPKGSICIDGVSLTVGKVSRRTFSVYLIPHTLTATTLSTLHPGDKVNLETDILAKYVVKGNAER